MERDGAGSAPVYSRSGRGTENGTHRAEMHTGERRNADHNRSRDEHLWKKLGSLERVSFAVEKADCRTDIGSRSERRSAGYTGCATVLRLFYSRRSER